MNTQPWLSIHIFYASHQNPLLLDCIEPLIDSLRREALIQRFFFIRYWQEGSHIRLRLLPSEGVDRDAIKEHIEPTIRSYLKRRPALYNSDHKWLATNSKKLFQLEYGEEQWRTTYGNASEIPLRPNNSFAYIPYEPEYTRYGGAAGMALAEWHFEQSSIIVLKMLRTLNVHDRSILLGTSIQLSLLFCYGLLQEDGKVITFLENYIRYWQDDFLQQKHENEIFEKKYRKMATHIQQRMLALRQSIMRGATSPLLLTPLEQEWIAHVRELRHRITGLVEARQLTLQLHGGSGEPEEVNDLNMACSILLGSYLHMTNNRLGVSIADEVYLNYLLKRALLDLKPDLKEVVA